MIQRLFEVLSERMDRARARWHWLGYALTLAAVLYILAVLFYSGVQLGEVGWAAFWQAGLASVGLYLVSLILQFFVWARLLSFHHAVGWRDLQIYSQIIMMRHLPGGIWHWIGRAAMYTATTAVPARVVVLANFCELGILILVGVAVFASRLQVFAGGVGVWAAAVALAAALGLAVAWQSRTRSWVLCVIEAGAWVLLYAVCWLLGGTIVYLFVHAAGGTSLEWLDACRLWALSGSVSTLVSLVPAAIGAQEVSLTWILQPHLPLAGALLVALFIRIVFTLSDLLGGAIGLGLSYAALQRETLSSRQL